MPDKIIWPGRLGPSGRAGRAACGRPGRGGARVAGVQVQPGKQAQDGLDGDLGLQPGQVRAQAEVRAVGEGQVAPGVGAADDEGIGLTEDRRVPVRRGDGHRRRP